MSKDQMAPVSLRALLTQETEALAFLGGSSLLTKLVLKHGIEGRGIAHGHKMGVPKECFKNAAERALWEPFDYVEGYAMRDSLCIPIHHAWLLNPDGEVIDVTWDRPEECQYLGIKIGHRKLRSELLANEVYGLFDLGGMLNIKLMREIDAGLVDAAMDALKRRSANV